MVLIKCIGGSFDGVFLVPPPGTKPASLLASVSAGGNDWQLDYSHADWRETLVWWGVDLIIRVCRAFQSYRQSAG